MMKEQFQKLLLQPIEEDAWEVLNEHPTWADAFIIEVASWQMVNGNEPWNGYTSQELDKYCKWCTEWLQKEKMHPKQTRDHFAKIKGDSTKIFQYLKDNDYISNTTTLEKWEYMCSGKSHMGMWRYGKGKITWLRPQYLLGVFIDTCFPKEKKKWNVMRNRFELRGWQTITKTKCLSIRIQVCSAKRNHNQEAERLINALNNL